MFEFERTLHMLAQDFECRDVRGTGGQAILTPLEEYEPNTPEPTEGAGPASEPQRTFPAVGS